MSVWYDLPNDRLVLVQVNVRRMVIDDGIRWYASDSGIKELGYEYIGEF